MGRSARAPLHPKAPPSRRPLPRPRCDPLFGSWEDAREAATGCLHSALAQARRDSGGRSQGRARTSSELLARRCSMERHSTPSAQARCAPRSQPGHEQPPVQCSAAHQLPPEPAGGATFFTFWRLQNQTSLVLDRGSMVPRLIASRRGGPPEISVAPGAMGGPGQRGGRPRLALKIGLLELPTACSAGLCQSRRRQDFPSSHAAVAGRRCTVDERRRLDDAVTAMLETWHMRECEVKICRLGSDVESLLSVSAGVSRVAFRTSSVGGLCVLDVER